MEISESDSKAPARLQVRAEASEIESDYYLFAVGEKAARFGLRGDWTILTISELEGVVDRLDLEKIPVKTIEFHCGGLQAFDLSGAWLLYRTAEQLRESGFETSFSGFRAEHLHFIDDVLDIEKVGKSPLKSPSTIEQFWISLERAIAAFFTEIGNRSLWIASISTGLVAMLLNPRRFRWISTARHINDAGISAMTIVALMAFLVAMVLGFQAKTQLSAFGAQIFTIDLVSISILREMGGLLTAILVAGRSGSAYAAEIGVMKLNEEISAMETMGINPYETLIIPRMVALLVCLPLLTFIAAIAGLLGTLLMATVILDIPANLAIERFLGLDPMSHFRVGMIKAPFFALVIGMIGTYRGFYVESSADAVGRNTTSAVVESIFMVIAVDAVFSLIFTEINF